MKNGVCPKCESTIIIQGVRVNDRSNNGVRHELSVSVFAKPDAWIMKGEATSELWACVCGVCGFVELYATNVDALVKAAAAAQFSAEKKEPADPAVEE